MIRGDGLPRRLLGYALLNRYWGLDVMLELAGPGGGSESFDDLERALFPRGRV